VKEPGPGILVFKRRGTRREEKRGKVVLGAKGSGRPASEWGGGGEKKGESIFLFFEPTH